MENFNMKKYLAACLLCFMAFMTISCSDEEETTMSGKMCRNAMKAADRYGGNMGFTKFGELSTEYTSYKKCLDDQENYIEILNEFVEKCVNLYLAEQKCLAEEDVKAHNNWDDFLNACEGFVLMHDSCIKMSGGDITSIIINSLE